MTCLRKVCLKTTTERMKNGSLQFGNLQTPPSVRVSRVRITQLCSVLIHMPRRGTISHNIFSLSLCISLFLSLSDTSGEYIV